MTEILFEDPDLGYGLCFRFPMVDAIDEQGHRIHQVQHEKVSKKVREELQKAIDAYESCHAKSRDSPKPPG